MILNPQFVIDQGWVTGIAEPKKQIQPNAIEFTMDIVRGIDPTTDFIINRDGKKHRDSYAVEPVQSDVDQRLYWVLDVGSYDVCSNLHVDLPANVAVKLIIRSTYSRNGMFLTSGLYDSGYEGAVGACFHNVVGVSRIEVGERLGQAIFETADSEGEYAGGYNHEQGTHWTDK